MSRGKERGKLTNGYLFKAIVILFWSTVVYSQTLPTLLEMLALYPEQDAIYIDIKDSTAVNFKDNVYVYNRFFHSEAMVLRKGGGGISSSASPVLSERDKIEVSAFTITPEGDTITVPEEEITALQLHGNKRRYVVSFPDDRAGAVFVFDWSIQSAEPVFSGRRYLGRTYPVYHNKTIISAPANWVFNFVVRPSCLYEHHSSNTYTHGEELWLNNIWEVRALPGLIFEDDSPPVSQLIPCLYYAFSHDKSWSNIEKNKVDWCMIASSYRNHLESLKRPSQMIKRDVKAICQGVYSKREKIRKIIEFVTTSFRAVYSDIDISEAPDELLSRGSGSQAEASFLLGAFLREANIPFDCILISTRDNGEFIKALPALFYFNRLLVAARIDNDTIWIDPLYRGAPLGVLPFEDQAVDGIVVKDNFKDFITTPVSDYRENGHAVHLKISFNEDGDLIAEGIELLSGSLNIEEKSVLQGLTSQEKYERWANMTSNGLPGSSLEELDFSDIYSDINPFKIIYKLVAPEYLNPKDTRLYIPLDILGRWRISKNYNNRKLPIELGRPHFQQERITIEIPQGFKVEYLPDNFTLTSYLGEIFSVVVVTANTITITRGLGIKPYRLKISAAGSLNGFYSKAMDQAGKYIVLRR